jgi:hypothetical protein
MIQEIHDSKLARDFLNSVPFDQYVPEDFPVCNPTTIILGWYDPDLVCCFPCQKLRDVVEIHVACVRGYRGKRAVLAAKEAFKWIFSNTSYDSIVANITLKNAKRFAVMCGMRRVNGRFEVTRWAAL